MKKITRVKAIRLKCIDCAESSSEIKNCLHKDCNLHPYRMGKRPKGYLIPSKSIRKYCLWCCNNNVKSIELCPSNDCPLYIYRFGYVRAKIVS